MITPHLEKLILCGKASYNTFVIGGSEKQILNVSNDRFIIITDLTYFSQLNLPDRTSNLGLTEVGIGKLMSKLNTQLRVFSRKSNNTFLFRNQINVTANISGTTHDVFPIGSVKLDTFLIHDQDVSFTWSQNFVNTAIATGFSPSKSVGQSPPYDYGLEGQDNVIPVSLVRGGIVPLNIQTVPAGNQALNLSATGSLEFIFPVITQTQLTNLDNEVSYPICNVGYVEILGSPTNIGGTF